jgi:hypothetical protein
MCKITNIRAAALGALLVASSTAQASVTSYSFADIDVPGSQPGSTGFSFPLGLNNLGQVAGSYNDSSGNSHGFLYSGGQYFTINAPGANDTYLAGINNAGDIVGVSVYLSAGKDYVFLESHGKFTNIADNSNPSVFFFLPGALNDRDQAIGLLRGGKYGLLDARGVITPINTSGANGDASFSGLNNRDQFTGTLCDSLGCHGFIDTKGVFTKFDYPGAPYTAGSGINDRGQVVGAYFTDSLNGFLYTNGNFITINDPNASAAMGGTWATAVNDVGQIAGFYYDAQGEYHSFLATPSLSPFASTMAALVPDAVDAVPEPSTWAMILLGFAGLGFIGLRNRHLRMSRAGR